MIPVHGSKHDVVPDLATLVVNELEAVERGLKILARGVPLEEGVSIDAIACDVDKRPVLVLVESVSEDLHQRAADALVAYRRSRALLVRLLAADMLDDAADPRLLLVARRFSEREEARCKLLPGSGATLVEVAVVDSSTGRQVLLLARGGDRAVKRSHGLRLLGRLTETAPNRTLGPDGSAGRDELHGTNGSANGSAAFATAPDSSDSESGVEVTPAGDPEAEPASAATPFASGSSRAEARDYLEEMKLRILRMSPDVLEEQDGDILNFRIGSNLLATLSRIADGAVRVDLESGTEGAVVRDPASATEALDRLIDRFFNLASTRRRLGSIQAPGGRPMGRDRAAASRVEARAEV